jgi:anti-anti-sigma factor
VFNVLAAPPLSLSRIELPPVDDSQVYGRAIFDARHLSPSRAYVDVTGEVDATNREALGHFVMRHTGISRQLVLDLSMVDFFGTQGFTALYYLGVQCARRDVDWMIVANRMVTRIVAICDTAGDLPMAGSLNAALSRLDHLLDSRNTTATAG